MSLNSTIYEITLSHNGHRHIIESLCVEPSEVTLIKAVKAAIVSLKSLGFHGNIQYCTHTERDLLPDFSFKTPRF